MPRMTNEQIREQVYWEIEHQKKLEQTDTLIIAAALQNFAQDSERNISDRERAGELREQVLAYGASMCQPVTPKVSEDCISREAVEEMLKAEMPERGMWEIEGDKEKETVCEVCVDLMQKLSELPPVTPTDKVVDFNNMISAGGRIRNHPLAINAVEKPDINTTEQGMSPCNSCRYSGRFWNEHPCYDCIAGFRRYEPVEQQKEALEPKRPEIIRCKNCRHDNNCEIQHAAQAGGRFFCGSAESEVEK